MYLIRLNSALEVTPVTFTPGGGVVGFGNATMVPAAGDGETVEQEIEIQFAGTAAQIDTGTMYIGRFLQWAVEEAAKPGGSYTYLECQAASTDDIWRSPVYAGHLELTKSGIDQRGAGTQGAKLVLTRANWWERATEVTLLASQTVDNHRDSGHYNYIYTVANATYDKDMPGQARLTTVLNSPPNFPVALFVGERCGSAGTLDLFYEGQDGAVRAGVTGTSVSDSSSSNGSHYKLDWTGASELRLWQVDTSTGMMALARGKPFRVVMRIGGITASASELMWAKWELAYVDAGGVEQFLYESPGAYLPYTTELIFGPILYLPPWVVSGSAPSIRVVLKVQAAGSGAHTILLDYVSFVPLDGWRYYDPTLKSYGISVNDYGQSGMAGPEAGVMTHALEGPGFTIRPFFANQFEFFFLVKESATLISSSVSLQGTVNLYYRPRRKML